MSWSFLRFFKAFLLLLLAYMSLIACGGIEPILSTDISKSAGLVFSQEAENAVVTVSNAGGGTLAWTASLSDFNYSGSSQIQSQAQTQWLELANTTGELASLESSAVTLKRRIMPAGNYSAVLTMTYQYNGRAVSEQFPIRATVLDRPSVKVDSPFSRLNVALGQTSFYVQNGSFSDKVLNWSFDNLPNWLVADKTSGSLSAGQESLVRLSLRSNLPPGNYEVDLGISGIDAARKTLKVVATYQGCVAPNARYNLAPQALLSQALMLQDPADAEYVSGQLLVRFNDISQHDTSEFDTSQRDEVIADYASHGLFLLEDGQGIIADVMSISGDPKAVAEILKKDMRIANAQPNYYLDAQTHDFDFPQDTYVDQQWYLKDYGVAEGWERLNYRQQMSQQPVIVAVIDSGTDTAHKDLASNLVPGCDFFGTDGVDNNPVSPLDPHGTHVAGIVAAVSDNNLGTVGVSHLANVKVQPIKIFSDEKRSSISSAVKGIRWAAGLDVPGVFANQTPAHILNFSVGKPAGEGDVELHQAVADVIAAGKLFVSASGNQNFNAGNGVFSPANAPGAISVGSLDSDLQRSNFSKFDSTGANTVDVMAPGGSLVSGKPPKCSTSSGSILNTYPNNDYKCQSGTSMATPYVAAVLALVWSQNPDWNANQVEQRLYESVYYDASWAGKSNEYGKGLVCLDRALGASTLCGRE